MRLLSILLLLAVLSACETNLPESHSGPFQAYVPVYANPVTNEQIAIEAVRSTTQPGKIYAWGQYIFQNELYEGIHIIDNSQPDQPHKIAFVNIPFNTEFAVRGSYIYANNISDLIVIDIQDPQHPVVLNRIKDAFPVILQNHPPAHGYFVCPDPSKGIVVNWELKTVDKANCRR